MTKENLHLISEEQVDFESAYIQVRKLENRVYSDEEVKRLPLSLKQSHEWKLRAKSAARFEAYLAKHHPNSSVLEIGCGNGWFANVCAKQVKQVCGVDLNKTELEQASRVFNTEKLDFYYWDIFDESPFRSGFDLIVLNAVVQYFSDFAQLLERLKTLLGKKGEIHLIDSPFYFDEEIPAARQRTRDYYEKMGVPAMSEFYFHHNMEFLSSFETMYKPNKIRQVFQGKDSPFCWYKLSV